MAVLNEALIRNCSKIHIGAPFLKIELFELDIGSSSISHIVNQHTFDSAQDQICQKLNDEWLRKELPTFSDLRDAFQNSMVISPQNVGALADLLKEAMEKGLQLHNPRPIALAIDTNVAYKRVMSRFALELEPYGIAPNDLTKVKILIPQLVRLEITNQIGQKYDVQFQNRVEPMLGRNNFFQSMRNSTLKKGRKAQNAISELGNLKDIYATIDVQGKEWVDDKERRDALILDSLVAYQREHNIDIRFVTADDKATAHLESRYMSGISLRYPPSLPDRIQTSIWYAQELIYELSIVFGTLTIKGLGVDVMGDWSGKTFDDYRRDRVKLIVADKSNIRVDLERDIRIIQNMRKAVNFKDV